MAAYEHPNNDLQQELFHDWFCTRCCKTVSPNRPPFYNPSNCSCSQAGTPLNDPHLAVLANGMTGLHLHADAYPYHQAPTVSSDGGSIRAPEGPERSDPSLTFLPLAPATGLGEDQHRRRASFDELEVQLDYTLRRYLETLTPLERSHHDAGSQWDDPEMDLGGIPWLRQDTHLIGPTGGGGYSIRAAKGSSKESIQSSGFIGSGSSGWRSHGINPVLESGTWVGANVFENWPDTLMIDDCAIEDDEDDE